MKLETLTFDEEKKPEKDPLEEEEIPVDDEDIYLPDLFECNPSIIGNKDNNFVYLPESFPPHLHDLCIFDINSTKTNTFNLGTVENPRKVLIASEITIEERKNLEDVLMKYAKVFAWSYEDMSGVDRSRGIIVTTICQT